MARHGLDELPDPDVRVGFATLVRAGAEGVQVDDVVAVEPRALSRVLHAEQRVSRRLEQGSRAGARFVARGSRAIGGRMGGRPGAVVTRGGNLMARAVGWTMDALRGGLHALAQAPDLLLSGAAGAEAHMHARTERRAFLRGLLEPRALSREGKAAALALAVFGLVAGSLLVTAAVVLAAPGAATAWRALLLYFLLGIGSTTLFPFFPETRLDEVAAVAGGPAAVLSVSLGMSVGAWLVLFLGESAHGALRRGVRPGSGLARLLDRAEAFAQRHGFWSMFLILAIPMGPDTPVFYVAATVGTPTRKYLLASFLGTLARFSIVLVVVRL